ncbi:hypothetical protein Lal_00039686 [Lupinus albus]|uniref:U-box domain-containing protein n=1 Tax=Lupinus albus TaxID=3870 RepID=A0A6A5MYA9_LUPAL|nr:putative aminoacyltransferase, E1 ubiquitin-activating enzyme [Lupinus albus]KAF1879814.1 hypothetical protein Lal_00039686 [Lupinus albus]
MEDIDVPPLFLCPISLEIMKDPVTVSTGISYDRESIEKWIFSGKNKTCPVTKQPLSDSINLTPNHTLRRLIQAWCTINASHGVERIPTPKCPINKTQIEKLIKDASLSPQLMVLSLGRLKTIVSESEANKRCMEEAGAVEFLASIVMNNIVSSSSNNQDDGDDGDDDGDGDDDDDWFDQKTGAGDEALSILYNLHSSEAGLKTLIGLKGGEFIDSLTRVMQKGIYDSRAYAVLLLKSISEVANHVDIANLRNELFMELVQVLKDQISSKASKAALLTLIQLIPWGRNRIKAVEAGAIAVLVDLLLDSNERKGCEMMLVLLEMLCQSADGRAELLTHGAGLAIVSKKILRVSTMANDRAVRILLSISRFSATTSVVQEMLQLGIVAKLCLVLQVDSGNKTKEKAREILKLHARSWRNSTCIPRNLLDSYP